MPLRDRIPHVSAYVTVSSRLISSMDYETCKCVSCVGLRIVRRCTQQTVQGRGVNSARNSEQTEVRCVRHLQVLEGASQIFKYIHSAVALQSVPVRNGRDADVTG